MVEVTIGAVDDKERLLQTLVLGFAADPVARWVTPRACDYLKDRTASFDAFGGKAFAHGSAFVANDGEALALWLPPGIEPDGERMFAILAGILPPARLAELGEFFGQVEQYHPNEPYWYLPVLAADPAHQGKGLGTALMRAALERVDADGTAAFLETGTPRNVEFYKRFGFEALGEVSMPGSPTLTPMLRRAR